MAGCASEVAQSVTEGAAAGVLRVVCTLNKLQKNSGGAANYPEKQSGTKIKPYFYGLL